MFLELTHVCVKFVQQMFCCFDSLLCMAIGLRVVWSGHFMFDVMFLAPLIKWVPELWASICADVLGETKIQHPFGQKVSHLLSCGGVQTVAP